MAYRPDEITKSWGNGGINDESTTSSTLYGRRGCSSIFVRCVARFYSSSVMQPYVPRTYHSTCDSPASARLFKNLRAASPDCHARARSPTPGLMEKLQGSSIFQIQIPEECVLAVVLPRTAKCLTVHRRPDPPWRPNYLPRHVVPPHPTVRGPFER